MYEFCVFAGTTEGREITELLAESGAAVTAFVATEYGESLIKPKGSLTVTAGRLDEADMEKVFTDKKFDLVIDATHPYASVVTDNIVKACGATGTKYLRVLREAAGSSEDAVFLPDIPAAADYLRGLEGNILLTTGSKELDKFTGIRDFSERVYARVLPMESSLEACSKAGLSPSHIIAMQGPFSFDMNVATLKTINAACLVTKDSGGAGGFEEKAEAAKAAGARLVIIGRPPQVEGLGFNEAIKYLREKYGLERTASVTVVGIGPGSPEGMTIEAKNAIKNADCLIGAKRMTDSAAPGKKAFNAIPPEDIAGIIREHGEYRRFAVLMSGDTGFYSGTKKLLPLLAGAEVRVLPGISSILYFCARLGIGWDDALLISAHGRACNYLAKIRKNPKVIALTGGDTDANVILADLCANGLGHVRVTVGSDLSYETERIVAGTAEELKAQTFPSLAVLMAENPAAACRAIPCGKPDGAFLRAEVPMTKQEVRAVTLAKLGVTKRAVCWDVGAGTGSVSLEMAECAEDGVVYAVEQKPEACELIEKNKLHLGVSNVTVVRGTAPEALEALPAPTHVFIGGSSGNMKEILELVLQKNPQARIVLNTVTAESLAEAVGLLKSLPVTDTEIVELSAAHGRRVGRYHLMTAQNPVFVISMTGGMCCVE